MKNTKSLTLGMIDLSVMLGFVTYAAAAALPAICLVRMSQKDQLNFNLTEGGLIHSVRMSMVVIVLLFSGFIAAKTGKCKAIAYSSFLMAAAVTGVAFAPNYFFLLGMVALIGISHGCLEGLLNPVIQAAHPGDSGRYLNFLNGFWSVGLVGTMILGGEMLSSGISWRTLYFIIGLLSLAPAVLFWKSRTRIPYEKPGRAKKTFRQMMNTVRIPRFWYYFGMMLLAGAVEAAYTYWSAPYFQNIFQTTPRTAGWLAALYPVGMFAMRFVAGAKVRQDKLLLFLFQTALLTIFVTLLFPIVGSIPAAALLLTFCGVGIACFWPSIQSIAADELNADSTMVFILLSCAGIPGAGVMVMIMGILGDWVGLRNSFFAAPAVSVFLSLMLYFELRRNRKISC